MDVLYDEQRGNPPAPECLVSWAIAEEFYQRTAHVLEWAMPADGDATYRVLPIVRMEAVLKVCKVESPLARPIGGMMEKVLHLFDFIEPAFAQLVAKGWLEDEDGNAVAFASREEINESAWSLIKAEPDNPAWVAGPDSFDDLEPLGAAPTVAWTNVEIGQLVEKEGTLETYVDLSRILHARDVAANRTRAGRITHITANNTNGLLLHAVANYVTPGYTVLPHEAYLAARLDEFLTATRWPEIFYFEYDTLAAYAYELPARARVMQATRKEWNAMLSPFLLKALGRATVVQKLVSTHGPAIALITREIDRLGDALIAGMDSSKSPMLALKEINELLIDERYDGLIDREIAFGKDSAKVVQAIVELAKSGEQPQKETEATSGVGDELVLPKRGQVRKAITDSSMTTLSNAWETTVVQPIVPRVTMLAMLDQCFAAESVLPKAVLIASPGSKLAPILDMSPFLAALHDQRQHLASAPLPRPVRRVRRRRGRSATGPRELRVAGRRTQASHHDRVGQDQCDGPAAGDSREGAGVAVQEARPHASVPPRDPGG